MNVLIRFAKGIGFGNDKTFQTNKDVKEYFSTTIYEQKNYFYYSKRIKTIEKDDILYFSFQGKVLVVAQFTGEYNPIKDRNFDYGYQIKNINILNKSIHINNELFKGQNSFLYIRTEEQKRNLKGAYYSEEIKSIIIKSLYIKDFTLFKSEKFNFSKGINIFIGENGTGKTHILKTLYSTVQANNSLLKKAITQSNLEEEIFNELNEVFRSKKVKDLRSFDSNSSNIILNLSDYIIDFSITEKSNNHIDIEQFSKNIPKQNIVFIPAKEFLSNFKGFRILWEEYSIPFDKTYYDLAKTLDRPLLKNISSIKEMNDNLEDILQGEIIQENGEFYLKRKKDEKLMIISMLAEGLRKIGTISYLLRNGSLSKDSILIWDEPESNLNPKHIRVVANLFIYLEKLGIQIFIATHSLFLIKEIEILRKKENNIKYFSFAFDEKNQFKISQDEVFEYLDDIVILDEAIEQSDRFMREVD